MLKQGTLIREGKRHKLLSVNTLERCVFFIGGSMYRKKPKNYIDLSNLKFGRLIVKNQHGADSHGQATWICSCSCGRYTLVRGYLLRCGKTRSCGCLNSEINRDKVFTHGESKTKVYRVWTDYEERYGR